MRNGASDRLFHLTETREAISFLEVLDLYEMQIKQELEEQADFEPDLREECNRLAQNMREAARIARTIYEGTDDKEFAAKVMQTRENEYVAVLGEALESGDWAILAI